LKLKGANADSFSLELCTNVISKGHCNISQDMIFCDISSTIDALTLYFVSTKEIVIHYQMGVFF
jgi:hypothetical protein